MRLAMGGIDDGGYATHDVRDWCRGKSGVWVPMKGAPQKGKPLLSRGVAVDVNRKNRPVIKGGVMLYHVGYDASVNHLQGRLRNETPGPGYLHLGEASTDQFLDELFPWKRMPKRDKGQTTYHWIKPTGANDEAGDCTRYAYAALQLFSRRYNRATMWDQLERRLTASKPEPQPQPEVTPVDPIMQRRKPQSKRRGNFVSGW
jgi:phage terminase large subunit GpA-like protein